MAHSPLFDEALDSQAGTKKAPRSNRRRAAVAGWSSLFLSLLASGSFVGAGMSITADRSERTPVVTWQRAAMPLSIGATVASCIAFGLALYSQRHSDAGFAPGWFAVMFCAGAGLLFLMYLVALYED